MNCANTRFRSGVCRYDPSLRLETLGKGFVIFQENQLIPVVLRGFGLCRAYVDHRILAGYFRVFAKPAKLDGSGGNDLGQGGDQSRFEGPNVEDIREFYDGTQ